MKAKYTQMSDKALVKFDCKTFKTECCDCGLVHLWIFKQKKGEFYFEISRDNRATGQRRRKLAKDKEWRDVY